MAPSINARFAAVFAAIACAIITIGFSVAPAVTPISVVVA
jgi:hypothetical protein